MQRKRKRPQADEKVSQVTNTLASEARKPWQHQPLHHFSSLDRLEEGKKGRL